MCNFIKRLLFIPIIFMCSLVYGATPNVTAVNDGVITCVNAGSHADYNLTESYIVRGWEDFETGALDGNFEDVGTDLDLTTSNNRTGTREGGLGSGILRIICCITNLCVLCIFRLECLRLYNG